MTRDLYTSQSDIEISATCQAIAYWSQFSHEHDVQIAAVLQFVLLGRRYATATTHACNGDAHPASSNPRDKNQNAKLWHNESDRIGDEMDSMVKTWGFDHCDFGVGLYPTIQRTSSNQSDTTHFVY